MCDTTDRRAFLHWYKNESDLAFWHRNAAWQAWQECADRMRMKEHQRAHVAAINEKMIASQNKTAPAD